MDIESLDEDGYGSCLIRLDMDDIWWVWRRRLRVAVPSIVMVFLGRLWTSKMSEFDGSCLEAVAAYLHDIFRRRLV